MRILLSPGIPVVHQILCDCQDGSVRVIRVSARSKSGGGVTGGFDVPMDHKTNARQWYSE